MRIILGGTAQDAHYNPLHCVWINFVFIQNYYDSIQLPTLAHLWTIAVEEKFYLVYPLFLMLICLMLRDSYERRIALIIVCILLIILGNLCRYDFLLEMNKSSPKGITKSNFGKESVRRNLIIADLFHRMDKMEKVGSGIRRMRDLMKTAGLKELVFESDTFFRVIFYRDPEYALKQRQIGTQKSTQKILEAITQNKFVTREGLANQIGLSDGGVKKQLKKLQDQGVLKRIGPDKGGHWEILKR